MVRTFDLSCDPKTAEALVAELSDRPGVISIARQKGASVKPPGDVVTIQVEVEEAHRFLQTLQARPELRPSSFVTSSPTSVYTPPHEAHLERQSNEATWEEMHMLLRLETNVTHAFVALMFLSGVVAAVGLWSDTLHLVVGAMVIAPGFQPLLRGPLGLVTRHARMMGSGVWTSVAGYASLIAGAAAATAILHAMYGGKELGQLQWVQYWSTIEATGVLLGIAAGAAGTFSIATRRAVLSAGAMIALALVPSAALIGMALASSEPGLAGDAAKRWLVDVVCVTLAALLVFAFKRQFLHRRPSIAGAPGAADD